MGLEGGWFPLPPEGLPLMTGVAEVLPPPGRVILAIGGVMDNGLIPVPGIVRLPGGFPSKLRNFLTQFFLRRRRLLKRPRGDLPFGFVGKEIVGKPARGSCEKEG